MFTKTIPDSDIKLKALGKRIKTLRNIQSLTQVQFANICDMEKSSISKIEAGLVNVTYLTLDRISGCLGVEMKDLVSV